MCCFNTAGLLQATAIRKAAGSSNHWKVLKSALLRVTPTQLITRVARCSCSSMIAQGPSLLFPPTGVMKRQFWTLCCKYEKRMKILCKGTCIPKCELLYRVTLSHSSFYPSSLPPAHNTRIPSGEQMYLFL